MMVQQEWISIDCDGVIYMLAIVDKGVYHASARVAVASTTLVCSNLAPLSLASMQFLLTGLDRWLGWDRIHVLHLGCKQSQIRLTCPITCTANEYNLEESIAQCIW
eukprot:jgi/Ulvmu1/11686/UM008_0096.1